MPITYQTLPNQRVVRLSQCKTCGEAFIVRTQPGLVPTVCQRCKGKQKDVG